MAKIVEFKEFKVIECTARELMDAFKSYVCICDNCGTHKLATDNGYYISVLNRWFCESCYEEFKARAKYYIEDKPYEDRNFERAKQLFNI